MPRRPLTPSSPVPGAATALAAALLAVGAAPASAHAWAEARARSATAEVRWDGAGERIRVALEVELEVRRGWVEGFELSGLDAGLVLDPDAPPELVDRDAPARRWRPEARVEPDGDVSLRFRRRGAPDRGTYLARLVYEAPAPDVRRVRGGRVELAWSLPPWAAGLDGPRVTLAAPWPLEPPAVPEGERLARRVGVDREGGVWRVTHERVHLPRRTRWTVTADAGPSGIPAAWLPTAPAPTASREMAGAAPADRATEPATAPDPPGSGAWFAVALWLLAAAWQLAVGVPRVAARRGAPAPPHLVPGPASLRAALSVAAAAAAAVLGPTRPGAAAALLAGLGALHARRACRAARPPAPGVFAPAPGGRRSLRARAVGDGPLDLGAPLGRLTAALAVLGWFALAPGAASPWGVALALLAAQAWLLVPPAVWPEPARARLERLRGLAEPHRARLGAPLRGEILGDPDGAGVVRLAVPVGAPVDRADLALDRGRLVAVVRARDVPADAGWAHRLDALAPRRAHGRRTAWVVPGDGTRLAALVDALGEGAVGHGGNEPGEPRGQPGGDAGVAGCGSPAAAPVAAPEPRRASTAS